MMREIRLADCETVVISLPEATDRRTSTAAVCEQLGLDYRIMDAIACKPGRIGCGLSHQRALRGWSGERPLLILEDDVVTTTPASPTITVPSDADAVYLGISRYGSVGPVDFVGFVDLVAVEPVTPGLLRLHNVLGAHAILHLTDRWRTAAVEAITAAMVDHDWDPDRGLARIQTDFNVYAPSTPTFYQSAALQYEGWGWRQEEATKAFVTLPKVDDVLPIWVGGVEKAVRLVREGARLKWVWA
jgi:hypothetical protein